MEKRLTQKIDVFHRTFKQNIKLKMEELDILNSPNGQELLQFIFDHDSLILTKEDLKKRKRVKNSISLSDRCYALRTNHEQCTRRKKKNEKFCGTHIKGTPHGKIDKESQVQDNSIKVEVWTQDIKGIIYFIDNAGNVYDPQDIHENLKNPRIVTKYTVNEEGEYVIPSIF